MKQLLQDVKTGEFILQDLPAPALLPGGIIVQTSHSLVSVGTDKSSIGFARKNLLLKSLSRPDLVNQVITKARKDGLISAYKSAKSRLNTHQSLGYSSSGVVLEIDRGVNGFKVGDLVACAGAGYATHSEIVYVPKNLAVVVPNSVSSRSAAFSTLGSIALQGIRTASPTPGETVAVIGLGLLGQLTVQILQAYGFPVLGLDIDTLRVSETIALGVEATVITSQADTEKSTLAFSKGRGIDQVIITAAATTNHPVELAGTILRDRGNVTIVGDVKINIPRRLYYKKELGVRLSRSYGPGRYDPIYEEKGIDYPIPYVRWTEKRNIEEFLRLIESKKVDVERLITHTFPIDDAISAYDLISNTTATRNHLGVLLDYPAKPLNRLKSYARTSNNRVPVSNIRVGLIGGGNFAREVIVPALNRIQRVSVKAIATATGPSGVEMARLTRCDYITTDYQDILQDPDISLLIIATRHDLHAKLALEGLKSGKHVHVEKPLSLNFPDLLNIYETAKNSPKILHVGFNRRFAPLTVHLRNFINNRKTPLMIYYRINAGPIPISHWNNDPDQGGGRILGEVCHFVDFLHYVTKSRVTKLYATHMPNESHYFKPDDNILIAFDMADGSRGSILYTSLGGKTMPKEMIEIFCDGKSAVINNFRTLELHTDDKKKILRNGTDKGHYHQFRALIDNIEHGKDPLIELEDLIHTSYITLKINESLALGKPISIDDITTNL